jgi:hypothetical protein
MAILELKESIANHDRQMQNLRSHMSVIEPKLIMIQTDLTALKSVLRIQTQIPLPAPKSVEGIIAHLTQKCRGNVHDAGIVTITSKSITQGALRCLADLNSATGSWSNDAPNEWVCWNFGNLRVRPTHYTIYSCWLSSWLLEGSLDGVEWIEIDRRTDNFDLEEKPWLASFPTSNSPLCGFIRLTQTGENHKGNNELIIAALEVFGMLLE